MWLFNYLIPISITFKQVLIKVIWIFTSQTSWWGVYTVLQWRILPFTEPHSSPSSRLNSSYSSSVSLYPQYFVSNIFWSAICRGYIHPRTVSLLRASAPLQVHQLAFHQLALIPFSRLTTDDTEDHSTTLAKEEHFPPSYSVFDMLVLGKMTKQGKFVLVPPASSFYTFHLKFLGPWVFRISTPAPSTSSPLFLVLPLFQKFSSSALPPTIDI